MASKKKLPKPTDAELEILQVLWKCGPGTVREIHLEIEKHKESSYNTTLKLLQIMHDKGLAERDETRRPQVYRASVPEEQTQRSIIADVLRRVFGGSARKLAMALAASDVSAAEIAEIRALLGKPREKAP